MLFFQKERILSIFNAFEEQIIKGILKDFSIKEFIRIGYIRRYIFDIADFADTFVNRTIGDTLEGINDINLNFSKRIPLLKSITKDEVNDYDNVIFRHSKEQIDKKSSWQWIIKVFLIPFFQHIHLSNLDHLSKKLMLLILRISCPG